MIEAPKLPEDAEEREAILKAFKMEHSLTQTTLAKLYGVSRSKMQRWISRKTREKNRRSANDWSRNNRERANASRCIRLKDPKKREKKREQDRAYGSRHKEENRRRVKQWRKSNLEKVKIRNDQYRKKHPEQFRQRQMFRGYLTGRQSRPFIAAWVRCSPAKLIRHIEYHFDDDMTWENWAKVWFVGFREPFDFEDLDAARKGWHYLNLKPQKWTE